MFDLFGNSNSQPTLAFPTPLTEKYRPRTMAEFVGLAKPKTLCAKLAANPFPSAWLFVGPSGTGKTTMALALGEMIPAEIHHIPSQECDLANLERVCRTCAYVPMVDGLEIALLDLLEWAAQQGGWDAPCWERAAEAVRRGSYVVVSNNQKKG